MSTTIPFNRPAVVGTEPALLEQALVRSSGDGPFCRRAERLLEAGVGSPRALCTTSCTHALEMSALLLDLVPGDEVILPSFTFVSTANAFALRGAKPVFVDVRADTLNIDETLLEAHLTKRTKAIVVVHYGGVACEMDAIGAIAKAHGIPVIEDNAHGLFGRYRGKALGSMGVLATQSFHETKNFSCGEGGALLVNDTSYVDRAEILREKGTNRSRFFRGQVDKYTWVDVGSSYVLSDVLGAILVAQLEARERIQARRHAIWSRYAKELASWAAAHGVRLPIVPDHCEHTAHLFYLLMHDLEQRTAFIAHLAARGVQAVFHYQPLHRSPMGLELAAHVSCPVTERVADQLVRLPLFFDLSDDAQSRVIEAALSFG